MTGAGAEDTVSTAWAKRSGAQRQDGFLKAKPPRGAAKLAGNVNCPLP